MIYSKAVKCDDLNLQINCQYHKIVNIADMSNINLLVNSISLDKKPKPRLSKQWETGFQICMVLSSKIARLIIILINFSRLSDIDFQVNMDTDNDLKYGKAVIFQN